jgi:nicotinamide-nucleotide amidase
MSKAAIVTIGTEITDGQIINSNSQWIAQRLQEFHIPVSLHISAPDDAEAMKKSFQFAKEQADLIFIAGGLGPTSDDITRDILSDFLSLPLELCAHSWQEVKTKLEARNVILREGHQRQCLFPRGAQSLNNDYGVAPGFYLEHQQKHFWILPGPPPEIYSIWEKHISSQLSKSFSQVPQLKLKTWLCLGLAESELAHQTEMFFAEKKFKKHLGYRLQVPYVEIKLWYEEKSPEARSAINQFTETLKDYYVGDDIVSINSQLAQKLLKQAPLLIEDQASSGFLLERLNQIVGPIRENKITYCLGPLVSTEVQLPILKLYLENNEWLVSWQKSNTRTDWKVSAPSNKKSKWREAYLIEKLILKWTQEL